ncbi:MAG TPA: hypothetical protein VNW95_00390 [Mucilaginibacter sp.]|jgi:hypothetical protein|nr:hypothetical protein [Mucilaginibacter sp.]
MEKLNERAIDAHLIEYEILNTRCAYFINLQFIILTGVVTSSAVMITEWHDKLYLLLSWWPIFIMQIFSNLSANMFVEQYRIVRYVETTLKPIMIELTNDKRIWGNETSLIKERKSHLISSATFWENIGIIIIGILIFAIAIFNFKQTSLADLSLSNKIGLPVNVILFVMYAVRMQQAIKLRTIYK